MGCRVKISNFDSHKRVRIARLLVSGQFALLGGLTVLSSTNAHKKVHPYLIFEILLVALGGILIMFATNNLKPSLKISPIPEPSGILISVGIYKYVRHPMYLAVLLIGFGISGYADSLAGWLIQLLLLVILNIKASFEDALLLELHPDALHYQFHTSKLIPCLGSACNQDCPFITQGI